MNIKPAVGDPAYRLKIFVPYAGHPVSVNEAIRSHGAMYAKAMDAWRDNAMYAGRAAIRQLHLAVPLPPSVVRITCPMRTAVRRDLHNYSGTLTKSIIDGLVKAQIWEDDATGHLTAVDPRFVHMPDLADPAIRARAVAMVTIVPLDTLRAALEAWPILTDLFADSE